MKVVGGAYNEHCDFPYNYDFFGPGLRGIASIQEISNSKNELFTCVANSDLKSLEVYADSYDFCYTLNRIDETVSFHYLHNHSNPRISPRKAFNYNENLGEVDGDAILRFGLVEGNAKVIGKRVVYDPQSSSPVPFHENGSEADTLAIVLNRNEAMYLTNKTSLEDILKELTTSSYGADVAVIKCGALGAMVRESGSTRHIPVFKTNEVWNIGSGDVFSAIFAVYWAEKGLTAMEAAEKASLATAYYCSQRTLPIPSNLQGIPYFEPTEIMPSFEDKPQIYLAAPFFNIGQLWFVEEVQQILVEEGAEVISPYHDIGRIGKDGGKQETVMRDLEEIDNCDMAFAILDNLDSGTLFELGYAQKAGKPVFVYKHEPERERLTMLEGTDCHIYKDLASAVFNAIWSYYE